MGVDKRKQIKEISETFEDILQLRLKKRQEIKELIEATEKLIEDTSELGIDISKSSDLLRRSQIFLTNAKDANDYDNAKKYAEEANKNIIELKDQYELIKEQINSVATKKIESQEVQWINAEPIELQEVQWIKVEPNELSSKSESDKSFHEPNEKTILPEPKQAFEGEKIQRPLKQPIIDNLKKLEDTLIEPPDVFISYVEEDMKIALEIALYLEKAGYNCWNYTMDSIPGKSYLIQTKEAVERAKAFLFLISPSSIISRQVTREIIRAYESNKELFPVLYNISHLEFQDRQPEWREAIGAAASIQIPSLGVESIINRIITGLKALNIHPMREPDTARIEKINKTLETPQVTR